MINLNRTFYALYLTTIILFVGFSYFFIDPNFFYFRDIYTDIAFSNRFFVSAIYIFLISMMFLFYIVSLKKVIQKEFKKREVLILMILSIPLLASYPAVLSYDIFNYLATAKVTFFYIENPYIVMPVEFLNDPMLLYTRAANKYALYGPFWIVLSGIPYALSFHSVIVQIFTFKLFVALFYAGTSYLLYKLSKSLTAVVLFALNPLILIETFVSGHNDVVMIFLSFLGFYFLKQNRVLTSWIFLLLSILIKFSTIFLIPAWIYILYKKYKKENILWKKVWLISLVFMTLIFVLSPLREEMYPWYFLWLMPFIALYNSKRLLILTQCFSYGLLAYYIPYMYTGHYLLIWKAISVVCFASLLFIFLTVYKPFKKHNDF